MVSNEPAPHVRTQTVIATYDTYREAQRAVDYLSDEKFPVEHLRIIGSDLRLVEQVTGRLTWLRAAGAGIAAGMWIGLFFAILIGLFAGGSDEWARLLIGGLAYGALFGLVFGLVSYALSGGKRDFTSTREVVALHYDVTCTTEHAQAAAGMLTRSI